jgi:hypothetical protein
MQCPVCEKDMVEFRKRTLVKDTNDNENQQTYTRAHFRCEEDNIWARVEFPQSTQRTTAIA